MGPPPPPPLSISQDTVLWHYTPRPLTVEAAQFNLSVYTQYEDEMPVESITKVGDEETSGVIPIQGRPSTFYLKISAANTEYYTVTVEENITSIPEFPSLTAIRLAFTISLVALLICGRKLRLISR